MQTVPLHHPSRPRPGQGRLTTLPLQLGDSIPNWGRHRCNIQHRCNIPDSPTLLKPAYPSQAKSTSSAGGPSYQTQSTTGSWSTSSNSAFPWATSAPTTGTSDVAQPPQGQSTSIAVEGYILKRSAVPYMAHFINRHSTHGFTPPPS